MVLLDGSGVAIDWVTGRTPPHEDGSMYSQFPTYGQVRAAAPQLERSRPWSWTLKKVLREADGPVEGSTKKLDSGGKVIAPGCISEPCQ